MITYNLFTPFLKINNKIASVASFVITQQPFATLQSAPLLTFTPSNFSVGY